MIEGTAKYTKASETEKVSIITIQSKKHQLSKLIPFTDLNKRIVFLQKKILTLTVVLME